MAEPNADLIAAGEPRDHQEPVRTSPASSVCYMAADEALPPHTTTHTAGEKGDSSRGGGVNEGDSTPRSEAPSLPEAVTASLYSQMQPLDPELDREPSYFSPQPRRLYSSRIPRSTPASSEPSPSSSVSALAASINLPEPTRPEHTAPLHPDRPAFQRDLSSASTASNSTVRAKSIDPVHTYATPSQQRRDGPVYPNQSYAALHLQQHPPLHHPPVARSRSSHPAHSAGHSLSGLATFGLSDEHYRDVMDSAPRTVGNTPATSPGLFDPSNRRSHHFEQPDDGLYSSPWLHHTHRQAPKETHIADVQADPVSGRKIINQYEIIDELGRGMHGKVKLGKDLQKGNFVAIKIVDRYSKKRRLGKSNSHEDKIKREIAILKKARHPNIVSLLEVIDDPAKKKVYIVLEHVELGEVKWRTEGTKEVCMVEWRRFKRESHQDFDNDSAVKEDEKIIRAAHDKLAREQRHRAKQAHDRRQTPTDNEPWSFEFGGDSDDEYSEAGRSSRASGRDGERPASHVYMHSRRDAPTRHESTMETAFRSPTPAANPQPDESDALTGLEGTMYGAYVNDIGRMSTPSITGSSTSQSMDSDEDLPEHFRYVPLMTTQAAWEAFKDTVLGLEYLHYQNVYHRDIKPANLLVTKEHRIKISDFGVSYLGRSKTADTVGDQSESEYQDVDEAVELAKTVGTPAFYAPELCSTEFDVEAPKIDGSIDVWALGVTLYCLIYGRVPFHDTNEFTLMKVISEEEPYIPEFRLKPVAEQSSSRPNSHGRNNQSLLGSKRAPHDLEFEKVDDRLRDLIQRLLVKDSRYRITIPEIKRHPWVLSGISNHNSWVEETDPGRSSKGRRIEISKADLEQAVVPIGLVERVRSAVKKTFDFVAKTSGRGSSSRRRAQSSVTSQEPPPTLSANSSSSTISQDARQDARQEGRRGSLIPGHILEVINRSRDPDHPLSHSVTASPEARERSKFFETSDSRTSSPAQPLNSYRPQLQDRAISLAHTIRHSDMVQEQAASPSISPALPGTPVALDTPGGSNLGGLFGGLPRRVVNSMRSKDKLVPPPGHSRTKSIDRLVGGDDDAHGIASLAISTTVASGHVDQPDALKDLSPVPSHHSTSHSDTHSRDAEYPSSRQSSASSFSSRLQRNWAHTNELEAGPLLDIPPTAPIYPTTVAREVSDARAERAKDAFIIRKVREENTKRERPVSGAQTRPLSAVSQSTCPPSPDDETFFQRHHAEDYIGRNDPSSESSPVGGHERGLAFCSSEEQFTGMSQSTSHPSIPSVASAGSLAPDACAPIDLYLATTSAKSIRQSRYGAPIDDPAGYDGDHAVESGEDDESDDDDGGLFIGKRKSAPKSQRSESITIAELAHADIRQEVMHHRRRSARSGSNGTVKKITPLTDEHIPTS
jgi:serine/threonine protein kinase